MAKQPPPIGTASKRSKTPAAEAQRERRKILECGICKDLFVAPVTLRCSHVFCAACVWTLAGSTTTAASRKCPICSVPIAKDDEDSPPWVWENDVCANEAQQYVRSLSIVAPLRELAAVERALEPAKTSADAAADAADQLLRVVPFDAGEGYSLELLELVDEEGGDESDEEGRTLLWWACETGKARVVQKLLNDFVHDDINAEDGRTHTAPLARAIVGGHASIVAALLAADTDPGPPLELEWHGQTGALELAVEHERHTIALMLIKHAPPLAEDVSDETATFIGVALLRSLEAPAP